MKCSGPLSLAAMLILAAACAPPPRKDLPGRYVYTNDDGQVEVLILEPDGGGRLENLSGRPERIALKWQINPGEDDCTYLDFYSVVTGVMEWHTCAEDTVWSIVIGHPGDDEMAMFRKTKW